MKEIWKDIPGYEGSYKASSLGNIMSLDYNHTGEVKILSTGNNRGYHRVSLYKEGKVFNKYVHRLVLLTFIGDSELECNHINGVYNDNRLENLEYCTRSENQIHKHHVLGRGGGFTKLGSPTKGLYGKDNPCSKPIIQYDLNGKFIRKWENARMAHKEGFNYKNISSCCRGKRKASMGYIWEFASSGTRGRSSRNYRGDYRGCREDSSAMN